MYCLSVFFFRCAVQQPGTRVRADCLSHFSFCGHRTCFSSQHITDVVCLLFLCHGVCTCWSRELLFCGSFGGGAVRSVGVPFFCQMFEIPFHWTLMQSVFLLVNQLEYTVKVSHSRESFSHAGTACELGGINSVRSYSFPAVEYFFKIDRFLAVCDLSRPREASEWPWPSFLKIVTNIAQHLALANCVSSCLCSHVRVLGPAV